MKAAVYYQTGGPEVFRYEDVPDPVCPPNGVVFDVKAVGIEGGDVGNRARGMMAGKPHIVGYNCAGVVREVGSQVSDRKPGDRVTALMFAGSHAERVAVAAAQTWLVPKEVSFEHAACVPVAWGTAHDCLFEFGRLQKGESVLIQAGGSGVGLACVQLAKRAGAVVYATAGSKDKLDRLKSYGLDHGIAYRDVDFVTELLRLTNNK
jgi:NADPH2:quinone reductase